MDLFFPQINIGIECDEAYHIENEEKDYKHEITMEQMLCAYEETENLELYRIKAYEEIENIKKQIDDVVTNVKNKLRRSIFPAWDFGESPLTLYSNNLTIESTYTMNYMNKANSEIYLNIQFIFGIL